MTIADAPGATETATPRRAALGVLFVHGIGEQKEGETLIAFGEPILDWIKRWLVGHDAASGNGVRVVEAMLFPSRRLKPIPAHAWIEIARDGEPPRQVTWLFAEAWWGEQVHAPGVLALLGWLVSRGPWIALVHFWELLRAFTRPRAAAPENRVRAALAVLDRSWRLLAWPLALVAWVLLTLHIQLSLLALSALALVPIPRVRRAVSGILLQAAGTLGDSHVLLRYETQRSAIVSRLRDAFEWLGDHADRVAIVAHSQGSAVAYDLLRGSTARPPWLLFTFGAGVAKLEQLRLAQEHYPGHLNATGWVVPLTALAVISGLRVLALDGTPLGYLVPWTLGMTALACLILGLVCAKLTLEKLGKQQSAGRGSERPLALRWVDRYASHDPVPHGPLDESLGLKDIESRRVLNRMSMGSDHTSYWRNEAEFVRHLVEHLDRDSPVLDLDAPRDRAALDGAEAHHRRAVRLLAWTRYACAAALGWVALADPELVARTGRSVVELVRQGPLATVGALAAVGDAVDWIDVRFIGRVPWHPELLLGSAAFAFLLFIMATVVLRLCFRPLWEWWDRALLIDAARRANTFGAYGIWLYWPFIGFLATLPALLLLLFWWDALASVERITLLAGGAVVATIFLSFVGVGAFMGGLDVVRNFPSYTARAWAGLVAATDPRAGWGGFWQAVFAWFAGVPMPLVVGPALIERGLGQPLSWTEPAQFLGVVLLWPFAAVLLEMRLYRLLSPPSTPGWVRLALVALPPTVALGAALSLARDASSGAVTAAGVLFVLGLVAAVCYALAASILRQRRG